MRISLILLLFLVSACGQTGKLYLPEDSEPVTQEKVTPEATESEQGPTVSEQTTPRRVERKPSIQRKN